MIRPGVKLVVTENPHQGFRVVIWSQGSSNGTYWAHLLSDDDGPNPMVLVRVRHESISATPRVAVIED